MNYFLHSLRWFVLRLVARFMPTKLLHWEMATGFVKAWTTAPANERVGLVQWCFSPRTLPDGRQIQSTYVEAFRLFGGIQNTFRQVYRAMSEAERTTLLDAGAVAFKTDVCPEPNMDDISGAVIQIACVTNALPSDLLGTVEGLTAARMGRS